MNILPAVLAAGKATRFGSCKQLSKFNDRTLINIAVRALRGASEEPPTVVLGAYAKDIQKHVAANCIFNPDFDQGIGSSLAFIARHATERNYDALLIHLGDLPLVTQDDISLLITHFLADPNRPVASTFSIFEPEHQTESNVQLAKQSRALAPPCIFPRNTFAALQELSGDFGAKKVLERYRCHSVSMPNAAYDVDFPSDIESLQTRARI